MKHGSQHSRQGLLLLVWCWVGMMLSGTVSVHAQQESADERFWAYVGTESDPPIAELLNLLQQRYAPYFQTAARQVRTGHYRAAFALYRQVEAKAGSQKEFVEWVKDIPQIIDQEVSSYATHASSLSDSFRIGRQANEREAIICAMSVINNQLLAEYSLACQGEVHVLMEEGRYAEAIAKASELQAGLAQRSRWHCEIGGQSYTKQTGTYKLNVGDMYTPSGSLCYLPDKVPYWYCLDLAVCYYQLREYEQARDNFLRYPYTFPYGCLDYYGKRFKENFQQVGYKELGGIIYLAQSSNVMGEINCPIRCYPDPRYTANYEEALKYAEEAYKLLPNNLDVCLQYYILLCTLKHYMQAIEILRHIYDLVNKGPAFYQVAQKENYLMYIGLVPQAYWDEWKKEHGGRDAFPATDATPKGLKK